MNLDGLCRVFRSFALISMATMHEFAPRWHRLMTISRSAVSVEEVGVVRYNPFTCFGNTKSYVVELWQGSRVSQ
jgi:hypothetical protein